MTMNQKKNRPPEGQVLYLNRWVDKSSFRAFVYNDSEQKLANSYNEFQELLASGLWFMTKEAALDAFTKPESEVKKDTKNKGK